MKPGPRGHAPERQAAAGETRPSRKVVALYGTAADRPDPENIPAPKGMTPAGRKIWAEKIATYRKRGQKVDGFQDALRHYCELEARLNAAWKERDGPPMAMITAYRALANEFYDTPASQRVPAGAKKQDNPFARNGKPAASA